MCQRFRSRCSEPTRFNYASGYTQTSTVLLFPVKREDEFVLVCEWVTRVQGGAQDRAHLRRGPRLSCQLDCEYTVYELYGVRIQPGLY